MRNTAKKLKKITRAWESFNLLQAERVELNGDKTVMSVKAKEGAVNFDKAAHLLALKVFACVFYLEPHIQEVEIQIPASAFARRRFKHVTKCYMYIYKTTRVGFEGAALDSDKVTLVNSSKVYEFFGVSRRRRYKIPVHIPILRSLRKGLFSK